MEIGVPESYKTPIKLGYLSIILIFLVVPLLISKSLAWIGFLLALSGYGLFLFSIFWLLIKIRKKKCFQSICI